MKTTYRKAILTDAASLARVHVKTWKVAYQDIVPTQVLNDLSVRKRTIDWKQWLASDSTVLVAVHSKSILGFISFGSSREKNAKSSDAEIYAIYIDPRYWRQGIGSELMTRALYELSEQKFHRVILWASTQNQPALKFYKKWGFVKTQYKKSQRCIPSVTLPEIQFQKKLTSSQNTPIGNYKDMADAYAQSVDTKPIHVYYERPGTLALLPTRLKGLKVLDLGCGSGWYAEQLVKAGAKVTAIDINERMVALTQKRLKNKARCIVANLEKPLTFLSNNEFDVIIAPLVIHYIQNWPKLFKELARVLKPKGLLIFSTHQPHTAFQNFKLDNYFRTQIIHDHWDNPDMDVQYYHHTLDELTESLAKAGFLIERLREPLPKAGLKKDSKLYKLISHQPWFLFVRALKLN